MADKDHCLWESSCPYYLPWSPGVTLKRKKDLVLWDGAVKHLSTNVCPCFL
jgi:hypothetical protein